MRPTVTTKFILIPNNKKTEWILGDIYQGQVFLQQCKTFARKLGNQPVPGADSNGCRQGIKKPHISVRFPSDKQPRLAV